jgi:hypothetical protein
MLLNCCILAFCVASTLSLLTVPLGVHLLPRHNKQRVSHLRHFGDTNETYLLQPRQTSFTLNLTVNDFPYELTIDTGSSDFFIKGEEMIGQP